MNGRIASPGNHNARLDGQVGGKPRILLLVDRPGWAYDTAAKALARCLRSEFAFQIEYVRNKPDLSRARFDLVHVFFWGETYHQRFLTDPGKVIKEISSHRWANEDAYGRLDPSTTADKYLRDAATLTATSRRLQNLFTPFRRVEWCPNGFDPECFKPGENRRGPLRVGWAGNKNDPCKGVVDVLLPAVEGEFELVIAGGDLDAIAMADFYRSIDVLCVASTAEGEPLTLVEGMACGCFPVCVDVGIVPELVRHKENGLIVERTVGAFREAFRWCAENLPFVRRSGEENARLMHRTRTWEIVAPLWARTFKQVLSMIRNNHVTDRAPFSLEVTASESNEQTWRTNLGGNQHLAQWPERARAAASLVSELGLPAGASLLDLGCGHQTVRSLLPAGLRYFPVDCLPRTSDTLVMDLARDFPAGHYDAAVMLGLLEYLDEPLRLLARVADGANHVVFSYNDDPDPHRRTKQHWKPALRPEQLTRQLGFTGGTVLRRVDLGRGLKLYSVRFDRPQLGKRPQTKQLALLSAAITSTNSGDAVITDAIRRMLAPCAFTEFPLLRTLSDEEIEQINSHDAAVICGTNLFQHTFACSLDERVLSRIKVPIIPLGVGASARIGARPVMKAEDQRLVRLLHDRCEIASVRDPVSLEFVRSLGIKNVELTGCPVLFHGLANPSSFRDVPTELRVAIRARLLHVENHWRHKKMALLHRICRELRPNLVLQSPYDLPIAEELKEAHGVNFVWNPNTHDAATLVDAVTLAGRTGGFRLHFAMLGLSHGRPATLIGSDTRVSSFAEMMGLPWHDIQTCDENLILRELHEPAVLPQTFLREWEHLRGSMVKTLERNGIPNVLDRLNTGVIVSAGKSAAPIVLKTPAETIDPNAPVRLTHNTGVKLPRILLIADVPDWIFEKHCRTLAEHLRDEFNFDLVFRHKEFNEDDYDLIYALEFTLVDPATIRNPSKYVTGIRSHSSWARHDLNDLADTLRTRFQKVHVVSRRLLDVFRPLVPNVERVTHGVDTTFFQSERPVSKAKGKLRLGWAGNRKTPTKGFAEFIEPLAAIPGVELVYCGYVDRNLNREEMPDFYDGVDAYICTSVTEGNNNSLLEAAAMERAIITTDVGTVPEYLSHGKSALIVPREVRAIIEAVITLRDDPALRTNLGQAARRAVRNRFAWDNQFPVFRNWFRTALENVESTREAADPTSAFPPSATTLESRMNLTQIEAKIREALAIKPDGVEALRLLAGVCLQSERWVEAANAARRVFELKPDDLDALSILAKCFFKTGDLESTRTVLERVLAIDPGNEMARDNLTALGTATLYSEARVKKLEELLQAGKEAVAAGKVGEAIRFLESAAQLDPQDADLCVAIASLQAAQGEVEAARRRLSQALAIDAKHTDAGRMLVELALGAPEAAENTPSTQLTETPELPVADPTTHDVNPSPVAKGNTAAFAHLQRGFDLLKERRFAEAQAESRRYRERVNYDALDRTDNRAEANPKVSVVIVAYQINAGLIQCLDSLAASQNPPHEIIVVDNGGNEAIHTELARRPILHVRVGFNVILAEGRNIGVHFARSNYAVFIDDDAIAAPGYLTAAVEGFESFDIHAFRGKVLPKSDHPHNSKARHYNLGDLPFPADIDTEGNSAFRIDTWRQLGGQDPLLFGGEGVELSRRIGQLHGDFALMYWPFMVIQHDYAVTDNKLETKSSRHVLMREYSVFKHPDLYTFHNRLVAFARNSETKAEGHRLLPRHSLREPARTATAATTQAGEPFISICVPTYNRAQFIEQTLASAFKQTHQNFEIVVVDDGSTDGTAGVMKRITDPRVRYILKEHSGGPETRNRCIAEAHGEFLVWLDSDDLLLPDTLARYATALHEHPQVDVLYGNLQVADDQLNVIERWVYGDYHGWGATLLGDTAIENRIPNVCTLVRKSYYARVGGYNPAFPRAHDYEFWTRLVPVASFKSVNADVGIYRRHEQSLSKVRQQVNTSYEAKAVKAMLEKHSLRALFPSCYAIGTPTAHGEARAWLIAALVMMKYGELASAVEFAGRSAGCAELGLNTRISGLLQVVSGRTKSLPGAKATDEFGRLVEQAARLFASGQVQPCAQACAKLTELRPDAAETLLLVGLSLRRWANPHDAKTAFRCLVQRQCERAHLETITEAEEARRTSAVNGHALAKFLAPVFRETSIPDEAIADALAFIARAAGAADPRELLSGHPANQTPLLFAILSLTPGELEQLVDREVAGQIVRLRTALQPATTASPRKPGYSFCIITGGQRREKLARQIASIHALNLPAYEILVGGEVSHVPPGVRKVALADAARAGRLGKMRNELGRHAEYNHVVVADDDLVFDPGFAEGLKRFGEGYDALAVRIVNPDGSRFWDWATTGGTKGSVLLDYWDADPNAYITGGICVLKTEVLERVQWDDSRGFYESEDVDFSTRLKAAGFTIRYNVFAAVLHDDDRYSRVERRIYQFDHLREAISQAHQAGELDEVRRLFPHAVRIAGNYVDRKQALQALVQKMNLPELLAEPPGIKPIVPSATGPISAAPNTDGKLEINWQGSFLDYGSLSNINRVLTDTLVIQNGASIRRLQTASVNGKLSKPLQSYRGKLAASANPNALLTVRHAWPPDWSRPASGKLAVIQPWEFGSLPKAWVEAARNVDAFWVPSNYVRQVYVDSGVPAEKVHVLPNGIDPKVFTPEVKPLKLATKKTFKFLFVGGTIYRKGPDVLLKAYIETFTAKDDVCLVIKDFGGGSVYAGQTLEQQIREIQKHANAPEILYLNQDLPPHELPGLYTACDCLAHPYRGEGFGLPVLEAMACGLPVIVTAGGATDDFVPDEAGYKIPAKRQIFGREISGMPLVGDGWLLEPDADAVKWLLRRAFANRDEARTKGAFASDHARKNWTWNHTASRLAELARECVAARSADGSLPAEQRLAGSLPASSVTTGKRKPAQPLKITLPPVAKLGHLGAARELLKQHKLVPAWNATLEALAIRPFHPEAHLLLAEIAGQTGDTKRMKECLDRARALAPSWKSTKQFSKSHSARKSAGKVELPPLPAITDPRLSVCLIAKNEERFLGGCLKSIRAIANQIVVVDTGSTDRTVAIAKEHGAEVHHFTWCDDFSAARNAALEKATSDWVLVLDADEELSREGIANLKQAMDATNTISWRLPIVDAGKEAEGCTYVPRLFRNAPGLFYVSRVHEQVFSSVEVRREEWNMETGVGTAKLIHHGYTAEVIKDRNKIARNLRLLELAIEEIPGDPNLLMNYGLELFRSERPAEGLSRYAEAFAALATKPANEVTPELRETLLTQYSSQLMKLGLWSELITVLTSPVAQRGGLTASLHFTLGLAHQELRQWTEAIMQFRECLRTRGQSSFYLVNQIILGGAPRHCLALALWKAGELAAAAQEFAAAVAEDPALAPLRMDAARFQSEHGDAVEALKLLHGLVTENSALVAAWVLGARVALSHPDFIEFARDWTVEAVNHHPDNADLIAARGETLLLTQQFADALPCWRQLNNAPRALSARVLCELMQGELSIDGPPANEAETSREFLNWYRRLIQFRAGAGVQAIGERLELLGIVLPSAGRTLRQILEQAAVEAA